MPSTNNKSLSGIGNTKGLMNPLIPFDVIVDTDFGMLALVMKKYLDPEVFDPEFFKHKPVKKLTLELYERREVNPLLLCIRDDYKDMADEFYNQFMEREYKNILSLSVITEMYRVVGAFDRDSDIEPTIVCRRTEELEWLLNAPETRECDIVMEDSLSDKDISSHNQFYFKTIYDMIPYVKYLKNKTIYLANYGFNRSEDNTGVIENQISLVLIPRNMLRLADIYDVNKLMEDEGNGA